MSLLAFAADSVAIGATGALRVSPPFEAQR